MGRIGAIRKILKLDLIRELLIVMALFNIFLESFYQVGIMSFAFLLNTGQMNGTYSVFLTFQC